MSAHPQHRGLSPHKVDLAIRMTGALLIGAAWFAFGAMTTVLRQHIGEAPPAALLLGAAGFLSASGGAMPLIAGRALIARIAYPGG